MTRRSPLASALLAVAGTLTIARAGRAQNAEQFYFSDDAAMTAGAVVAYPDDPGGLWYNPAALGGVHRGRVSLSGSVISVRARTVPGALEVDAGPSRRSLDLSATNLISTPHAFTLLFGPSDETTLGFGVYVTTRDVQSADSHALAAPLTSPAGALLDERVDLLTNITKVSFGPAIGVTLARDLRLGFALFGSLMEATVASEAFVGIDAPGSPQALAADSTRLSASAWGLALTGGLQWDATRRVHLGLFLRSPEVVLSGGGSTLRTIVTAEGGTPRAATTADDLDAAPGLSEPPRFVLGAALDVAPSLRLGVEVALATGLDNAALFVDQRPVVNGRIGLKWTVSDQVALGAGVFTDLATSSALGATLGQSRVDYAGGTLGGTLLTPLAVLGSTGRDALVLTTTIALRYSAGWGEARALSSDGVSLDGRSVGVLFHDFMPYTGSAVLF
jgi:hypothetical protein